MIPGEMQPHQIGTYGDNCGAAPGAFDGSIPKFALWQFDPAKPIAQRWRIASTNVGTRYETWMAKRDPKTGLFWRVTDGGGIEVYDPATDVWTLFRYPDAPEWNNLFINELSKAHLSIDSVGRTLYAINGARGWLMRITLDERVPVTIYGTTYQVPKVEKIADIPKGPLVTDAPADRSYTAWDSTARRLIFMRYSADGVWAYEPTSGTWEDLAGLPMQGGVAPIQFNSMTYSPDLNAMIGLGWTGIWLFRYGPSQ
jgi:hypothetical protein